MAELLSARFPLSQGSARNGHESWQTQRIRTGRAPTRVISVMRAEASACGHL